MEGSNGGPSIFDKVSNVTITLIFSTVDNIMAPILKTCCQCVVPFANKPKYQSVRNALVHFISRQTMIPRISKRYASTVTPKPQARKGRQGNLNGATQEHQPVTPEEQVRIIKHRIEKAERDEHMDITMALTPVKT